METLAVDLISSGTNFREYFSNKENVIPSTSLQGCRFYRFYLPVDNYLSYNLPFLDNIVMVTYIDGLVNHLRFLCFDINSDRVCTCTKSMDSWTDWSEIYTTANKPKASDIDGTLPVDKGGTGINLSSYVNSGPYPNTFIKEMFPIAASLFMDNDDQRYVLTLGPNWNHCGFQQQNSMVVGYAKTATNGPDGYPVITTNNLTSYLPGNYVGASIARQGALSYTPTTYAQTASVNGKYMTGDITIGAIPSNYKPVGTTGSFFDLGAKQTAHSGMRYPGIIYFSEVANSWRGYAGGMSVVQTLDEKNPYGYIAVMFRPISYFNTLRVTIVIDSIGDDFIINTPSAVYCFVDEGQAYIGLDNVVSLNAPGTTTFDITHYPGDKNWTILWICDTIDATNVIVKGSGAAVMYGGYIKITSVTYELMG